MPFCPRCGAEVDATAVFCPKCGAQLGSQAASPRSGLDTLTKESAAQGYWLERLFAFIVDYIVVWIAVVILSLLVFLPSMFAAPFSVGNIAGVFAGLGVFSALSGLLLVVYFVLADATYGRTLGKSLFHLKVVNDSGGAPTIGQSFIRNISKVYWVLLLLDVIVGLALDFDYKKKYSDKFAKTSVLRS